MMRIILIGVMVTHSVTMATLYPSLNTRIPNLTETSTTKSVDLWFIQHIWQKETQEKHGAAYQKSIGFLLRVVTIA